MGVLDGAAVGRAVGEDEGALVGGIDGRSVGDLDGVKVGLNEGCKELNSAEDEGRSVGTLLGLAVVGGTVGVFEGMNDGAVVGSTDGTNVGAGLGNEVGLGDGASDGTAVGLPPHHSHDSMLVLMAAVSDRKQSTTRHMQHSGRDGGARRWIFAPGTRR